MSVALVTSRMARAHDEDLVLIVDSANRRGADIALVDWDDPAVDWASFERIVVKSTWDYTGRFEEFDAWLGAVDAVSTVVNPVGIIRWNADKRYLGALNAVGVPIVPTTFVTEAEAFVVPPERFVVKPTRSVGSQNSGVYGPASAGAAAALIETILARGCAAMVQPYLDSVDDRGETGMLFFAGEYAHAFRKGALLVGEPRGADEILAAEDITSRVAEPAELDLARRAIGSVTSLCGSPPTYARVDVVWGGGGPMLMELELIEPSLFLPLAPASVERYLDAVLGG